MILVQKDSIFFIYLQYYGIGRTCILVYPDLGTVCMLTNSKEKKKQISPILEVSN